MQGQGPEPGHPSPSKKSRAALVPGTNSGGLKAIVQALPVQPVDHCLSAPVEADTDGLSWKREGSVATLHSLSPVGFHLAVMGMRLESMPRGSGSSLLHAFAAVLGIPYEAVHHDAVLEVCRNPTAKFIGMICEAYPGWPEVQAYTRGVLQEAATAALAGAVSPPTDMELRVDLLSAYAAHVYATDVSTPGLLCPGELELCALLSCHPSIGWAAVLSAGPGGELSSRIFGNTMGGGSGITLVLSSEGHYDLAIQVAPPPPQGYASAASPPLVPATDVKEAARAKARFEPLVSPDEADPQVAGPPATDGGRPPSNPFLLPVTTHRSLPRVVVPRGSRPGAKAAARTVVHGGRGVVAPQAAGDPKWGGDARAVSEVEGGWTSVAWGSHAGHG